MKVHVINKMYYLKEIKTPREGYTLAGKIVPLFYVETKGILGKVRSKLYMKRGDVKRRST